MALDPSFRSRLRDVLQQSVVGRPRDAVDPGASPRELRYEPDPAGRCDEAERGVGAPASEELGGVQGPPPFKDEQAAWIADALGGWWNRDAGGVCLVVDREYPADRPHGDAEIGCYAETLSRDRRSLRGLEPCAGRAAAPTLFSEFDRREALPAPEDNDRLLFFDLETTGLSGGAGTCVFLVGYGWFDGGSFRTRQFFLSGYAHEAALLKMCAEPLADITLTSFNGKTFDVPLITGRYLFHRVTSPFDGVPHIDLLHPARRLWRYRAPERPVDRDTDDAFARYFRATALREEFRRSRRHDLSASAASCALGALEEAVLGFRRAGDVPGADIPARYFHYVRTGDARPLAPVLEHNRLDLLSLAALASLVARMLEEGPPAARNPHECLALGRLYERSGAPDRATACYERAVDGHAAATWRQDPAVQREALRRLARRHRRERRYEEAAAAWQRLIDLPAACAGVEIEALQALAVHHEHRSKDLQAARAFVMRALDGMQDARLGSVLRCRLSRIERKLGLES